MSTYDTWKTAYPPEWDEPEYEFDYSLSTRENRKIGGYKESFDISELEEMGEVFLREFDDVAAVYPVGAAPIAFPANTTAREAIIATEEHLAVLALMTCKEDCNHLRTRPTARFVKLRILANLSPTFGRAMSPNAVY